MESKNEKKKGMPNSTKALIGIGILIVVVILLVVFKNILINAWVDVGDFILDGIGRT